MIIFALHSENSDYQELLVQLHEFTTIETFEDMDFLLDTTAEEDCHGIIVDYDSDRKKIDKEIKKIKKLKSKLPLFIFSNTLESKKLIKHQKSKFGASLYLQVPIDQDMLKMLIEPFWQGDELLISESEQKVSLAAIDQKIVDTHESSEMREVSDASLEASEKIDGAFSSVFPDEYSDHNPSVSDVVADFSFEEGEESVFPKEDDLTFPELDLSEMDLNDDKDSLSLNLEESIEVEDLSLESGIEEHSLSIGTENEGEDLSLEIDDEEDSLSLAVDENTEEALSLSMEEGIEDLALGDDDEENALSLEMEEGIEGLALGDEDEENALSLEMEEENDNLVLGSESKEDTADLSFGVSSEEDSFSLELESNHEGLDADDLPQDLTLDLGHDEDVEVLELSEESIDEMDSNLNLSVENEDLFESQEDLNDELTRPALLSELSLDQGEEDQVEVENDSETSTSIEQSMDLDQIDLAGNDLDLESENTILGLSLDASPISEEEELASELERGESHSDEAIEAISDELASIDENKTDLFPTSNLEDEIEVTNAERVSHVGAETKTSIMPNSEISEDHKSYVQSHDEELVRLGETINTLRADRASLLEKINYFEEKEAQEKRDFLGLNALLDEKKIELVVIKKRFDKQINELKVQVDLNQDKRNFLEKKNQNFSLEIEKLRKEHRIDYNRVHQRERELEEKLEMLRKDSEIQLRNRDQKILELKRKIDTLEFDVESFQTIELSSRSEKVDLEDKMDNVIRTLRDAIGQLEEDNQGHEKRLQLQKNLKR